MVTSFGLSSANERIDICLEAAVGRGPGGAVAGAAIGATTGAVIASEAQRRNGGHYWWRGRCYYRYPNGNWLHAQPGCCS